MPSKDDEIRRKLLDTLLQQPSVSSKTFGELLLHHGSILPEELPMLASAAASTDSHVRKNAVYLMGRLTTPDADRVLHRLATETKDPSVFVLAVSALRNAPDAKTLSGLHPELLQRALLDSDPMVQSAAVRVGFLSANPQFVDELTKRLRSPIPEVRNTLTALLASSGAGPMEGVLRELLIHPPADLRYNVVDLYQALAQSEDPTMAEVFRQSLSSASVDRQLEFLNGVTLSKSRRPWLRQLFLSLLTEEGSLRWRVFDRIAKWDSDMPEKELLTLCVKALEQRLPKDPAVPSSYDAELESCRNFVSTLAQERFEWNDLRRMLDFAKKRLHAAPP